MGILFGITQKLGRALHHIVGQIKALKNKVVSIELEIIYHM